MCIPYRVLPQMWPFATSIEPLIILTCPWPYIPQSPFGGAASVHHRPTCPASPALSPRFFFFFAHPRPQRWIEDACSAERLSLNDFSDVPVCKYSPQIPTETSMYATVNDHLCGSQCPSRRLPRVSRVFVRVVFHAERKQCDGAVWRSRPTRPLNPMQRIVGIRPDSFSRHTV